VSTISAVILQRIRNRRTIGPSALICVLIILLFTVATVSIGRGAVPISPTNVLRILASRLTGLHVTGIDAQEGAVLWTIRLPRVVLAITIGAALGISGASLQGIFRNPLADPGLIGVSSGAALGAVISIVWGVSFAGIWTTPLVAFGAAIVMSGAVFAISNRHGRVDVVSLILSGLAMNALAGAAIGFATSVATASQLRDITFWQLGSVGGASWTLVAASFPFIVLALVVLPTMARRLDILALGEREARHLGVSVFSTQIIVIGFAALAAAASVAVAGVLGFVGLVVPHLIRLINGPSHRVLLPASAIAGAAVLTAADLVARTAAAPREIPLGVMTALLGAPLFLWLIRSTRHRLGGLGGMG
jgi:iron complex transport system permease protein